MYQNMSGMVRRLYRYPGVRQTAVAAGTILAVRCEYIFLAAIPALYLAMLVMLLLLSLLVIVV